MTLAEYELGDKNKYLEMVLGKEIASKKTKDYFGNSQIMTSAEEIFNAHRDEFRNIDKDSIYFRRNWLLPEYILQNRLEDKGINLLHRPEGRYICTYIASQYFNDRRLYEIDPAELTEFIDLVEKQNEDCIVGFNDYKNEVISSLTEEELASHSMEILKNSSIVWYDLYNAGVAMEEKWSKCFDAEVKKVEEGQTLTESLKKYKEIIPVYKGMLTREKNMSANNLFVLDKVEELQYTYLEQLDTALQTDREGTIKVLTTGEPELWIDKNIAEVLDKHGIILENEPKKQEHYSTADITRIAIKGKFTLGEIEGLGIALENTKESESIKQNGAR